MSYFCVVGQGIENDSLMFQGFNCCFDLCFSVFTFIFFHFICAFINFVSFFLSFSFLLIFLPWLPHITHPPVLVETHHIHNNLNCTRWADCNCFSAGFIKSPLSQMKLVSDSAELHCEVIGNPIPEVQWWFVVGEEPNETFTQLFDGARDDRVRINATYIAHATSTILLTSLTLDDTGTYECRASNDPDRNELKKTPKIKWIRSQANIIVIEREWHRKHEENKLSCSLLISEVLDIQLLLHSTPMLPGPVSSLSRLTQYPLSRSFTAPWLSLSRIQTWSCSVAGLLPIPLFYDTCLQSDAFFFSFFKAWIALWKLFSL